MEQLKRLQLMEREMISDGKSASEIDGAKARIRQQAYSGIPPELSGVGSLSETARNMNRGPRGLAGYMAHGGPVYMKNGGGSSEANARKDVLSTIYEIESNSNYDQWNLKAKNPPEAPLSSLTIQEIMDFQGDENGPAAGAGQIKYNTLKYLIKSGVLSPDDVFSPENQDAANSRLLDRRGFVSWFNGDISTEEFGSDVAKEWASLPLLESRAVLGKNKARGDSRYGGSNKALVGADYWQEALDSAKVSQPTMVASADTSGIETFLPQMEAQATPTQPDFYDPTFQGLQMRTPEASSMPGPLEPERPPVEEEKQYASLYEKYAPQAMQDALQGIGYFNSPTGPSGYQNFADGGEASVVRLGGYSKKSAPRPVNAPVGRQSMSLTREDQGLLVDFLPIAGDIKGGVEGAEFISEEFKRENPNYLLMGIVGGAAVLGVIPFAGDVAQKMIMRGARNFRKNRVTEETLEMLSEQDANIVQDLTDKTPVSELTDSQRLADEIASDLRAGNIDSVTDDRLELLDVQGDIRLRQHYIDGNVGTDADGVTITLDTTARMDRARSQGYDPDSPIYHGSNSEIRTADPDKGKYRSSNTGLFTTDVPDVADAYIRRVVREEGFNQDLDGRMYPLLARNTDQGWDVDVQGGNWNNITRDTPALNRRTNAPGQTAYDAFPELFDRKMPPDRPPDVRSTNDLAREARLAGDARINFLNMSDRGGQYKRWDGETHEAANLREKTAGLPSNVRVDFDGANLRAPTAIFDQRLTHLKNIGMADGGAVMNGIGTLNGVARNMTRGPRGIGAYQQFADGGEGVRPQSRPPQMRPQPRPPEIEEMAEIRNYLGGLSDEGATAPSGLRPRSRPEKYFEINSYDINGETQDAIDFKDGMRMFMPDVERMITSNRTATEPMVGRETGQEVLEFLQENNPTSEEFINYFSSARLASGGEALGPPPLRGPDPQGIGAYQRFADGGPVYMAEGGLTPSNQLQQKQLTPDQQALFNQANIQQQFQQRPGQLGDLMGQLGRLMPPPTVNPFSSGVRGDGMSANDLQRMLSRQTIAPENVADTKADILSLQQAEVANRARRANPPTTPGNPTGPVTMPITPGNPFGPGGFPTNPYTRGPGFRLDYRSGLMPDYGFEQPDTIPELGFEPLPFEPDGGPGRSLYFTDGIPSKNGFGDTFGANPLQPNSVTNTPAIIPDWMKAMGGTLADGNINPNSGMVMQGQGQQGPLQPSNFQPSPTSFGIGGFEQPYQQQNMGSLGSNKPTANVLF